MKPMRRFKASSTGPFAEQWFKIRSSTVANQFAYWLAWPGGQTLAELGFPESNFMDIPARTIEKDNVEEFWAELKKNLGKE